MTMYVQHVMGIEHLVGVHSVMEMDLLLRTL